MRSVSALRPGHAAGLLLASAALLVAGCAGLNLFPTEPVEVDEIRRLAQCGAVGDATAVTLLDDEAALRDWQAARGVDLIGAAPGGLLPPGPFAVVDHGSRATGGYGLAISRRAERDGRRLLLTASFFSPGAGDAPLPVASSPCVLVRLPPGLYDTVSVVDPAGKRRAQSPLRSPSSPVAPKLMPFPAPEPAPDSVPVAEPAAAPLDAAAAQTP